MSRIETITHPTCLAIVSHSKSINSEYLSKKEEDFNSSTYPIKLYLSLFTQECSSGLALHTTEFSI